MLVEVQNDAEKNHVAMIIYVDNVTFSGECWISHFGNERTVPAINWTIRVAKCSNTAEYVLIFPFIIYFKNF